jgi:two-component system NtrC family sensor kinase
MALKGLKASIAAHLAVLFLLAMILIDFIMLIVAQETLIQSEIARGRQILLAAESILFPPRSGNAAVYSDLGKQMGQFLEKSGVACASIRDLEGNALFRGDPACDQQAQMDREADRAAADDHQSVRFHGRTFGIFWRQKGYALLALPLKANGQVRAGASLQLPLRSVYETLRRTQHIVLIYVLINASLFTIFGLYRLSQMAVKPVQRLLRRAQEFERLEDQVFFADEKEDNEYSRLSKSLNRMLMRIAQDKQTLHETIRSLEEANRHLAHTQQEMVRAEKLASVGRLSAGIAHEIGNPIGIVKGYLALLSEVSIPEDEKLDFIRRTEGEIERINAIIRQLLDFSRPSGGAKEDVSVHSILSEIGDVCRCQPMLACIALHYELNAPRDRVFVDPWQLRQVFLNLIINAADALAGLGEAPAGRLMIRTTLAPNSSAGQGTSPESLQIEFIDNGPGISDEHVHNIFDPFFTTKEPGKGTGLGLSVSFSIIESFGGSLWAANNPQGGLTMTVRLPLSNTGPGN